MNRREFLSRAGLVAGGFAALNCFPEVLTAYTGSVAEVKANTRLSFETTDALHQAVYSRALEVLSRNVVMVSAFSLPVLIEGSDYSGIWLECAPHEGLVYSSIHPDVARNNHMAFFAQQREDGQFPCWIRTTRTGFGQIQMVVPIAATAWELSQQTGDNELLEKAYASCSHWDAWLRRYRDTRKTGLCEGFCTWDTGHDNSPRWKDMPNRCPDAEARNLPDVASLPRLCPDLSSSVYGGRVALAAMARALGKNSEADRWLEDAATIRTAILEKLYVASDASFYDLDAQNQFVRIRGDVISRVLGEHVVDQQLFETIYSRQIHNSNAFWAAYPLPSIAMDDPTFVRPIPPNSWGGASQALTALRAPRWMEHYGKPADFAYLMRQWINAILADGNFMQQMDPLNGKFTADKKDYSPAALVLFDFTWRLAGVRSVGDHLEWNVRPPEKKIRSSYTLGLSPTRIATLKYASGKAELSLNGKLLCRTNDTVRLITDKDGKLVSAAGIAPGEVKVVLEHPSKHKQTFSVSQNVSVAIHV